MKHDIATVASHKTKQSDKFSFSKFTMSATVCDGSLMMSVTISDDPFTMSVTSVMLIKYQLKMSVTMSVTSVMLIIN